MSYWIDQKYLKLLNLERFTNSGNGKWNFRCPVCGDSTKSKSKKRGWAITVENSIIIKCFNCEMTPLHISTFLKLYRPELFDDYLKETFLEKKPFGKTTKKQEKITLFDQSYDFLKLQLINDLPVNHKAVKYLRDRSITKEMSATFYYVDNFSEWVHKNINESLFLNYQDLDRRIVIPFFNRYKKIFAFQGRTIDNNFIKYLTVKTVDSEDKVYGLDRVDFSKEIYVVEGPIDSLFLYNCVAMAGSLSNLKSLLKYTNKENIIVVPDNDIRNKQTKKLVQDSLSLGFRTILWPKNTIFKDINEAIKIFTIEEIYGIMDDNIYSGISGMVKFKLG